MGVRTSVAAELSTVLLAGMPLGVAALTGGDGGGSGRPDTKGAVSANDDRPGEESDHRANHRDERAEDSGDLHRNGDDDGMAGKKTGPPSWARSIPHLRREHGRLVRAWATCLGNHDGERSACGARPKPPGWAKGMPPGLAKRENPGHEAPDDKRPRKDERGED